MEIHVDEYRRYRLWLDFAMGVACICYLIAIAVLNLDTEVMSDRFWKDVEPLFHGELPVMEYPPLSLVFMAIPRFFAADPFGYNIAYVVEVFAFFAISLYFVDGIAEHYGRNRKKVCLVYSVLMMLLLEFLVDRYDIFPMVLTVIAFYCFIKEKYPWAFFLLAIGMMTKLYPAMMFPIFFLIFASKKDWNNAVKGTAVFIITTLAVVIPLMIIKPDMILNFLSYHSDRPLQIESAAASILYFLSLTGLFSVHITSAEDPGSFGSDNLVGEVPDAVAGLMTPIMVILVISVCLLFFFKYKNSTDEKMKSRITIAAIAATMLVFMIVGKVFSSQYLIWVIPFIVFLIMDEKDLFRNRFFILSAATMIMTQVNFVYSIGVLHGGANINTLAMFIMLVRNLMVIVLAVMTVKEIAKPGSQIDTPCD